MKKIFEGRLRLLSQRSMALLMCAVSVSAGKAADAQAVKFPDIAVVTPAPPAEVELAGDALYQFIIHHGTVHTVDTGVMGGLTRWRGGRPETVCPKAFGLSPTQNDFITARVREVASKVGAPVQQDAACKPNVLIVTTADPDKSMAAILATAAKSLGVRYPHEMEKELEVSSGHLVQGWYMTTDGGAAILNRDVSALGPVNLIPLWPRVITTGLRRNPGFGGIVSVVLLIDTRKIGSLSIGAISDYASVVALTLAESPEHCDPLPSILDMSANCGRPAPGAITAGDLAFLRALYFHNTGIGPTLTRDEIQRNMLQQFKGEL